DLRPQRPDPVHGVRGLLPVRAGPCGAGQAAVRARPGRRRPGIRAGLNRHTVATRNTNRYSAHTTNAATEQTSPATASPCPPTTPRLVGPSAARPSPPPTRHIGHAISPTIGIQQNITARM